MAWIGTSNNIQQGQDEVVEAVEKKPPSNVEEFLTAEGLEDWPLPMSFENPLDNKSDGLLMGTQDDIVAILDEAAPMRLYMLDEMENRLSNLEVKLNYYADQTVTEVKRPSQLVDNLFHSPSRTFMTEMSDSDARKYHRDSKEHRSGLVDTLLQTRMKSLDYFKFPGFLHGEFIELPAKLEAPVILHHVSTSQNFNPGFKKFWKKIFLSEASSAVLQDSFWWIFLEKFNKEAGVEEDKDLLFDRIADSYAALFTSINTDVKDKFLSVYPNCLSQALYCTYKEAFPESKWRFNEEFKHYLVTLIYEWITGLHPVPGIWKNWNEESLKLAQTTRVDETTKKLLEAAAVNMKVELNLDMDACIKVIDKLGTSDCDLYQGHISRENTKSTGGKSHPAKLESHQTGPGPEFERVKFNISGRSPLIAHYLHKRQLRSDKQPGVKVRRTEIVKLPPDGPTYQELIASTLDKSESLSKEYARIRDQTLAEILDINRWQRDTNKEINKLKKALTNSKNAQERSLAINAAMEYKESMQKGMPLIEDQLPKTDSDSSTSCNDED